MKLPSLTLIDYKFYIKKIINNPIEEIIPTEEDIEDSKKILGTLKDYNEDKTLINILKFQEDKIPYWNERKILIDELSIILLIGVVSFIISIIALFLIKMIVYIPLPFIFKNPTTMILLSRTFGITILVIFVVMVLILYITFRITLIAVSVDRLRKNGFTKGFTKWDYIKCGWNINKYISANKLPVKKILEWKLAICRDYARLTASLLNNLYKDSEIYLIILPTHSASGIKFNNKILISDPIFSLPTNKVSILNDWLREHSIDDDFYCLEGKIKNFTILAYNKSRYIKYILKYLYEFHEHRTHPY